MREIRIPLPEIGLIAGTLVALGVGIGLLVADGLSREQRQAAGWVLVAIGGLTTIPLVADVLSRQRCEQEPTQEEERTPLPAGTA
jgi:hypothetical protein